MNRIDRIAAILVLLQSRPVVKIHYIAENFGISVRTAYRDIRTLIEAGVPICGDSNAGYSFIDGYRLPPLMFTKEEAIAFLTAEKFIEHLTDAENSKYFHRGMDKVRAVLKAIDKSYIDDMSSSIEIYRNNRISYTHLPNLLQIILGAISSKNIVEIIYFTPSRNAITKRLIEPIGVIYLYPFWHLFAYCHYRKEYREFRMDRVEGVEIMEEKYRIKHPTLKSVMDSTIDNRELSEVIVRTTVEASQKMGEVKYYMGLVSEDDCGDGVLEQTYMAYSIDHIARWLLSNGDSIKIIKPIELKDKIYQIIKKIEL